MTWTSASNSARRYQIDGLADCVIDKKKMLCKSELDQFRTRALKVMKEMYEKKDGILAVDVLNQVFGDKITYTGKRLEEGHFNCKVECVGFEFYDVGIAAGTLKEKIANVVLKRLLDIDNFDAYDEDHGEETKDARLTVEPQENLKDSFVPKLIDFIRQYLQKQNISIGYLLPIDIVRRACQIMNQEYKPMKESIEGHKTKYTLSFLTQVFSASGTSKLEAENAVCSLALKSIIDIHFECVRFPGNKRPRTLFFSVVNPCDNRWKLYVDEINPTDNPLPTKTFAMTLTERIKFLLSKYTKDPEPGDESRFISPTTVLTDNECKLLEMIDANLFPVSRDNDKFTLSVTINEKTIFGEGSTLVEAKNATIENAFEFLEEIDAEGPTKQKKKTTKSKCLNPAVPVRKPYF